LKTHMTKICMVATLSIGLACLALGWVLDGELVFGLALLLLIPPSLALVYRKYQPAMGIILALTVLLAGIGLWAGVSFSLALLAIVCVLAAWDLDGFSRRLVFASAEDHPWRLERLHLMQVGLTMLVAVAVIQVSLIIRFAHGFEWALGLAVLAFYGIGALINAMRKLER